MFCSPKSLVIQCESVSLGFFQTVDFLGFKIPKKIHDYELGFELQGYIVNTRIFWSKFLCELRP